MEQTYHQLQSELCIVGTTETQNGSYLNYIKSRYQKEVVDNFDANRIEWQRDFDISKSICCNDLICDKDKSVNTNISLTADNLSCSDQIEVVLVGDSHSGSMFGSPSPILLDNFVVDASSSSVIDFGDYVPSGCKGSDDTASFNVPQNEVSDERTTSPAYFSGSTTVSHEEIDDNDEHDDVVSVDDDEEPLDDIFSEKDLPLRALNAFISMKNGSATSLPSNVADDNRFSVSDVYDFEIIEE